MASQSFTCSDPPKEFSRLMGLKGWSYEKANNLKVVIVGCGGLGNPVARLIARFGIGNIVLIDNDRVEIENLNRDGFEFGDIGRNKAEVLKEKIERFFGNHSPNVEAICESVQNLQLERIVEGADLVITATDNTGSRIYVNDICIKTNTEMIDAGFTTDGLRGHVRLILPGETACLRCTSFDLPPPEKTNLVNKVDLGEKTGYAISPAPTLTFLASLAGMMTFSVLFEVSRPPSYISANLAEMKFTTVELKRNPKCEVCKSIKSVVKLTLIFYTNLVSALKLSISAEPDEKFLDLLKRVVPELSIEDICVATSAGQFVDLSKSVQEILGEVEEPRFYILSRGYDS